MSTIFAPFNLPSEWNIRPLKRLLSEPLKYGANESGSISERDYPRYIRITDFGEGGKLRDDTFVSLPPDAAANFLLSQGDLLFARSGATVGKCFYYDGTGGPACFAGYLIKATTKSSKLNSRYCYYFTNSPDYAGWRDSSFVQTTIENIGAQRYGYLPVPYPPIDEQQKIVEYLDASCEAIDRAVETKQKQIEVLDALRKSIIQRAVTQGLDPNVEMKDSGTVHLGSVPKHWKIRRVKDVFEFHNHRRIPISSADRGVMTDRIYDYYGASGVIDKVEDYIFEGRYILLAEDGANLLSRSKQLAFFAEGKFWVNNHAHIIRPWRGNDIYWVSLLESQDFSLAVTGSAQPKLNMQNFGRFQLPVPSVTEQNEIADFVVRRSADCDKVKSTLSAQISTLTDYRKSLIHECVTGKRRISDADIAKVKANV